MVLLHFGVFLAAFAGGKPPRPMHHEDEMRYQYPLVEAYAENGLQGGSVAYTSANPPLFHLTFAALNNLGADLHGMRGINVLMALLAAVMSFRLLLRRGGSASLAWLLASAFALAPYCIGRSLLLFTDTFALLWFVAAFSLFDRWYASDRPSRRWLLAASVLLSLAVLTRQNFLWCAGWFGVLTLAKPVDGAIAPLRRAGEAAVWLLPGLVLLPFVISWQGLVPPAYGDVNQASEPNWRGVVFVLSTLGFYAGLLGPGRLIAFVRRQPRSMAIAGVCGAALCLLVGMRFVEQGVDDGYLWRISRATPTWLGANLLLTGLAGLGCLELLRALQQKRGAFLMFVLLFAASFLVVKTNFQKYYEAQLLLVLVWDLCRDRVRAGQAEVVDVVGRMLFLVFGGGYLVAVST